MNLGRKAERGSDLKGRKTGRGTVIARKMGRGVMESPQPVEGAFDRLSPDIGWLKGKGGTTKRKHPSWGKQPRIKKKEGHPTFFQGIDSMGDKTTRSYRSGERAPLATVRKEAIHKYPTLGRKS